MFIFEPMSHFGHIFFKLAQLPTLNLNVSYVNMGFPSQICSSYDSQLLIICVLFWT